jgi:hypothetical protein
VSESCRKGTGRRPSLYKRLFSHYNHHDPLWNSGTGLYARKSSLRIRKKMMQYFCKCWEEEEEEKEENYNNNNPQRVTMGLLTYREECMYVK